MRKKHAARIIIFYPIIFSAIYSFVRINGGTNIFWIDHILSLFFSAQLTWASCNWNNDGEEL